VPDSEDIEDYTESHMEPKNMTNHYINKFNENYNVKEHGRLDLNEKRD
jgi:hypothetical protein